MVRVVFCIPQVMGSSLDHVRKFWMWKEVLVERVRGWKIGDNCWKNRKKSDIPRKISKSRYNWIFMANFLSALIEIWFFWWYFVDKIWFFIIHECNNVQRMHTMGTKGLAKKERTQKTTPSFRENPTNQQNQLKTLNLLLCMSLHRRRDKRGKRFLEHG